MIEQCCSNGGHVDERTLMLSPVMAGPPRGTTALQVEVCFPNPGFLSLVIQPLYLYQICWFAQESIKTWIIKSLNRVKYPRPDHVHT